MKTLVTICLGTLLSLACAPLLLAGGAELPPESTALRTSALPGFAIASRRCGICHSSDYIAYQPPGMKLAQWTAEVAKMRGTYGAPVDDEEVRLIGIYLTAAYGDPGSLSASDLAARAADPVAGSADAPALLAAHACLSCHALRQKVVGPAYSDVAERYRADPRAVERLAASIRQGGAGRWGAQPMPPFADLSEAQAQALAAFVLRQ